MKHVLIISYVPHYNRQGDDLSRVLRKRGVSVVLLKQGGETNKEEGLIGVKWTRPQGRFHKFQVLLNHCRFVLHSLFKRKDIVVCVGKPSLLIGGIYKKMFGCELIYYALEYSSYLGLLDRYVLTRCVDKYIDVEENRLRKSLDDIGRNLPSMVVYNMPSRCTSQIAGGRLRAYLTEHFVLPKDVKIAVYAGSYQGYACIEKIVQAAELLPKGYVVVLMSFNLPQRLMSRSTRCFIVPPVSGTEFYQWLVDADCSLLPYESANDFNVQNCSPQKIFDCYLVGVPFVASHRPLVRKVLADYDRAGILCDFGNIEDIVRAILLACSHDAQVRKRMRLLHASKFNYDSIGESVARFIADDVLEP